MLKDGSASLLINTDIYNLCFNLDSGGSIFEWDYKPKQINLLDNFSRQHEAYHEEIRRQVSQREADAEGPKSIHHIQHLKEEGLDHYLTYDWYRRSSLLDHFLAPETDMVTFRECGYRELGNFVNQPYGYSVSRRAKQLKLTLFRQGQVNRQPLRIDKRLRVAGGSALMNIEYQLQNQSRQVQELWFGMEFNLNPLYQDKARTYFEGVGLTGSLHDSLEAENQERWGLVIQDLGLRLDISSSQPAGVWCFPIYTVSQAEAGYERVYQGSCILLHWRLKLAAGQNWQLRLKQQLLAL